MTVSSEGTPFEGSLTAAMGTSTDQRVADLEQRFEKLLDHLYGENVRPGTLGEEG